MPLVLEFNHQGVSAIVGVHANRQVGFGNQVLLITVLIQIPFKFLYTRHLAKDVLQRLASLGNQSFFSVGHVSASNET